MGFRSDGPFPFHFVNRKDLVQELNHKYTETRAGKSLVFLYKKNRFLGF